MNALGCRLIISNGRSHSFSLSNIERHGKFEYFYKEKFLTMKCNLEMFCEIKEITPTNEIVKMH